MKKLIGVLLLVGCHHEESGLATSTASALCTATPRALATLSGEVKSLARLGDRIYVVAGGTLSQIATDGTVVTLGAADTIFASGDDGLVWTAGESRELYTLRAGASVDLGVGLASFTGAYGMPLEGVAGGAALWADGTTGGGAYYALSLGGGEPVAHRLDTDWTYATAWIANGAKMAWIANDTLWSASAPDAAAPISLGTVGQASLLGLGEHVYATSPGGITAYADDGSSRLLAQPMLAKDDATCGHAVGKYGVAGTVVTDDEQVYLSTSSDCLDGSFAVSFWRADGTRLAGYAAPSESALFAVDDSCLYYAQDGAVMSVAR